MQKTLKRPAVRMPTDAEDRIITAAAMSDPDSLPLTDAELRGMVPMSEFLAASPHRPIKQRQIRSADDHEEGPAG
jgi:hypothetical protein